MTQSKVTIQITPESVLSTPSWMGESAAFAQVLSHLGLLKTIQEQVRFTRPRFGKMESCHPAFGLEVHMLARCRVKGEREHLRLSERDMKR